MLLEKSQVSFQQDFPFYLTVAYRAILLVHSMFSYLQQNNPIFFSFTQKINTVWLWLLLLNVLENVHWWNWIHGCSSYCWHLKGFFQQVFLPYLLHCGSSTTAQIWSSQILFSFSGDFNIPVNYMISKEASVFWFTKEAVSQLMNKRRPSPPLRLYPAMLWSKFS